MNGLWPLLTGDRRPWAGAREFRSLGPLLHWEYRDLQAGSAKAETRLEARPLFSFVETPGETRLDVLFPVASWRRDEEGPRGYLFWLGRSRDDSVRGTDEWLFTGAFGGTTSEGTGYSGLFPLYGQFFDRFGFDRIRFVLWPIYAEGRVRGYREIHVLWPFFRFGWGDGRFVFRFWPFYGVDRHEGYEVRRFWLWPFVHHRVSRLDTPTPERLFYVLPFYGRRDAGPFHSRFYLFPLYARRWDDDHPEVYRLDLPWPLYSREVDVQGTRYFRLNPLLSWARGEQVSSWRVGFGLLGRRRIERDGLVEDQVQILWMGRFGSRVEGERGRRHRDLWPLFRWTELREPGEAARGFLRIPYLLPFRGLDPDGWDRHYNKLFELYGERWVGEERRSSLLFGLREARESPSERWESWFGLLHRRR